MDPTERRVLDEVIAELGLPPGPEADEVVLRSFRYASRLLGERVDELGRTIRDAITRKVASR